MENSLRSTIVKVLDVAWRRRYLLAVPFMIMLPVSIVCAFLLAGGYTARSLVMLQETASSNPLASGSVEPNADRMSQTLRGLRALLASDYVLSPVVDEQDGASLDAATRAERIKTLARNVSVDLLGSDFLEFRLAGKSPDGLGGTLQKIMTSLVGALVTPPGQSAGLFALQSIKQKVDSLGRDAAALKLRMVELLPDGLAAAEARTSALIRQKNDLVAQDATSDVAEDQRNARLDSSAASSSQNAALPPGKGSRSLDEINQLDKQVAALAGRIAAFKLADSQMAALAEQSGMLQSRYEIEKSRLGGMGSSWSSMINAPERMIVVDPPKDPKLRTSSRVYFAFSGAFGGLLLGIALVILAEMFDTTLRTEDQMVAIAGVPLLASLPIVASGSAIEHSFANSIRYGGTVRLPATSASISDSRNHL